jgi:DNA helicase II / ATP-dependent DNA helicase PcrA
VQDFLRGLNDEQSKAVQTTEGPLLIQAGAGSGKTKTLTHRIAYILHNGLALPEQILAVTFTNKAAKEMRERIGLLLGQNPENRSFLPYMGTFHGICARILRQDGEHVAIPRTFVIYDEADRLAAIKQISKALHIDEKTFPARTLSGMISSAKNEGMSSQDYQSAARGPAQHAAAQVYPSYQKLLKETGALDFDDLLLGTLHLLRDIPEARKKMAAAIPLYHD